MIVGLQSIAKLPVFVANAARTGGSDDHSSDTDRKRAKRCSLAEMLTVSDRVFM
jgi:hypothetical protein